MRFTNLKKKKSQTQKTGDNLLHLKNEQSC